MQEPPLADVSMEDNWRNRDILNNILTVPHANICISNYDFIGKNPHKFWKIWVLGFPEESVPLPEEL